jgi:cytidylate kinase
MQSYVITVARGFGSGGKAIADALAKELGISCYENQILSLASQMSGLDQELFEEVNERIRDNKFSRLLKGIPKTIRPDPVHNEFVSDKRLFEFQKQIIMDLASSESCIIVGKCADWILRDYDNVISIYIEAPREYCVKRVIEKMEVSEDTAHRSIASTDKYRANYYQHYTGGNYWTNPVNYDLTFNSGRIDDEKIICLLKTYINLKFSTNTNEEDDNE